MSLVKAGNYSFSLSSLCDFVTQIFFFFQEDKRGGSSSFLSI